MVDPSLLHQLPVSEEGRIPRWRLKEYLLHPAVDGNLQDIPVEELAELFDWMVPPSRKYELEMYKNNLRRQAVREADKEAKKARGSKPGERMEDPRGYWTRSRDGDGFAGFGSVCGAHRESPPTSNQPTFSAMSSVIESSCNRAP